MDSMHVEISDLAPHEHMVGEGRRYNQRLARGLEMLSVYQIIRNM